MKIFAPILAFGLLSALLSPTYAASAPGAHTQAEAQDPIDRLSARLNRDPGGLWINGVYPNLGLPANATPTQVISKAFELSGFEQGYVRSWKLVTLRRVRLTAIAATPTSAALLDTHLGSKILLFRYQGPSAGWWSRFYPGDGSDSPALSASR